MIQLVWRNARHALQEGMNDTSPKSQPRAEAPLDIPLRLHKRSSSSERETRRLTGPRTLGDALRVEAEDVTVNTGGQAFGHREIMDIRAAANYLGVSRSHLSHILAGKVPGVPAIPHVRAGRRALIRRTVIDQWILEREQSKVTASTAQ
jgi:hypothetical protein